MEKRCRRLLRIPDAVEYLNQTVTASTIRGWIWRKQIEHVRIGGVVCISSDALDQMIERGRVPVTTVTHR